MHTFRYLMPLDSMERITRQKLCDDFDNVLDRVDKENIGFVILNDEGKDGHVLCPAHWMGYCVDDDFGCIINSALRYAIGRHTYIMVEAFPIIVYTKQLDDGSRKIMEIIEGEDFIKGKTVTRTLFRYDVTDNSVNADGSVKITGKHTQCSDISDTLCKRMMENGISAKELAAFTMKKEGGNDVD